MPPPGAALLLPDAADPGFRSVPALATPPGIRFCLGLPIPGAGATAIGALCCLDTGMTREEVARALQPFCQPAEGLNRPAGGSGLGLPLARAFVEAHGGRLMPDSAPGRGTLALLTLPPELALPAEIDLPRARSAS